MDEFIKHSLIQDFESVYEQLWQLFTLNSFLLKWE